MHSPSDVVNNFITVASEVMSNDRPDVWTKDKAASDIANWMMDLRAKDWDYVGTGGYILRRIVEEFEDGDSLETFSLTREVIDVTLDSEGGHVFDWTKKSEKFNGLFTTPVLEEDLFD